MAAVGLEEKYDAVRQLIAVGKERGYLLYDEVNDSLPAEVHSSEEIDDLLTTFERNGIEIYEDQASAKAARAVEVSSESGDHEVVVKDEAHSDEGGSDLDLTPGSLEKTNDPVRMYLREMGTVPLLTREGEVTIAKRIERGQLVVMKSITRSPIVIKELIAVGDDLRKGVRSIKEIVQFDDEELTEEKIANKTKQTLKYIDKIAKLYETALKQAAKLDKTPKAKKRSYIRAKWDVARTRVEISVAIRDIDFNPFEKKRLIDKMRGTVERLQSLEREAGRLERRADVRPFLRLGSLVELGGLLQRGLVQFRDLVDVLERLLGLVGDLFFGQLFVVKLHDLFDRANALAQIVADGNQFFNNDRRAGDGLHHHELAALDALGDSDFALARQQRHGAHLAQIHAHGIVRFFQ